MRIKLSFIISLILLSSLTSLSSAERAIEVGTKNLLELRTNYPAPMGSYQSLTTTFLQLKGADTVAESKCTDQTKGTIYYDRNQNRILICDGADWVIWDGLWARDDIKKSLYPIDIFDNLSQFHVGIGTTTPEFQLSMVGDGGLISDSIFHDNEGPAPSLQTSGAGTKFIWYPKKHAIRAGSVDADQWNDANIGDSSVAFGQNNKADGQYATVSGGDANTATGSSSVISGGTGNNIIASESSPRITSNYSTIAGGNSNTISMGDNSTIAGGKSNTIQGNSSNIAGGESNDINGVWSSIGGGNNGTITLADYSVISGGDGNSITGDASDPLEYTTISGGFSNTISSASATGATISGGSHHQVGGEYATISGGDQNIADKKGSVVAGGILNKAYGEYSSILGGYTNYLSANANSSVIAGGFNNSTYAPYSFVSGRNMKLSSTAERTFVWGYSNSSPFNIDTADAFLIFPDSNSPGRVGIGVPNPASTLHVNGGIRAELKFIVSGPFPGGESRLPVVYGSRSHEIGRDVAELFETIENVESGDVLIIDEQGDVKLRKSHNSYQTSVAGIVSAAPAILFEGSSLQIAPEPFTFTQGTKPPLALAGRVGCKVTNENGSIKAGDLLTTSSTPGHAMKATDKDKMAGAILGKALQSFEKGPKDESTGIIMVLVTLQ